MIPCEWYPDLEVVSTDLAKLHQFLTELNNPWSAFKFGPMSPYFDSSVVLLQDILGEPNLFKY